jgi:prevent-host-death family protein
MKKQKNAIQPNVGSVSAARQQFGQIMHRAKNYHERFIITHRGEPTSILVGIEEFVVIIAPGKQIRTLASIRRKRG